MERQEEDFYRDSAYYKYWDIIDEAMSRLKTRLKVLDDCVNNFDRDWPEISNMKEVLGLFDEIHGEANEVIQCWDSILEAADDQAKGNEVCRDCKRYHFQCKCYDL